MNATANPSSPRSSLATKLVLLALVVGLAALGWWHFRDSLSLASLAGREASFRDFQSSHPALVIGLGFLIYVAVTALSLPGAAVLTLAFGWFFGFVTAIILVSFASTIGATLAFLLSRFLFRDAIQARFGDRLDHFNAALEREGPFYLFTLRLIPVVPFFVINLVMGLTPIKTRTFWWVSQLGMLAGTAAYVYAGSSVPSLVTLSEQGPAGIISPRLFAAFVILGLLPFAVKGLVHLFRKTRPATAPSPAP